MITRVAISWTVDYKEKDVNRRTSQARNQAEIYVIRDFRNSPNSKMAIHYHSCFLELKTNDCGFSYSLLLISLYRSI